MIQKVRVQTASGVREYSFVPHSAALKAALDAGEVSVGEEIIYREWIAKVLDTDELVAFERAAMPMFSFTVNGVPFDPAQFAGGGAT